MRPPAEHADKDWHVIKVPFTGQRQVMWWDGCWRTAKEPVPPSKARDRGWRYIRPAVEADTAPVL